MRSRLLAALAVVLAGCSATPKTTIVPLDTNVSTGAPTSSPRPPTTETTASADSVAPQPGEEWVAFRSPRPDGRDGIFLARPDGSDRHQLVADLPFVQASPAWSPDGSRIAFIERNPDGLDQLIERLTTCNHADRLNPYHVPDEGDDQ